MSVIWSGITEEGAVVPVQVTEEGKVVAVGDGPQGDYLPITGGNLTGDLTIGTDKIELTADGSAEFAGPIGIGTTGTPSNDLEIRNTADAAIGLSKTGHGQGILQRSTGGVDIYSLSTGSQANQSFSFYSGPDEASATKTVHIEGDGSVEFAGDVQVGSGSQQAIINNNGSIEIDTANSEALTISTNGSTNCKIDKTGSATFAGGKCGFTADGEIFFTSRGTRYKLFVSQGLVQAEEYTRQMELKEKAEQLIADKRETKPSTQDEVTPDNDNA